jgi:DNA invertase Pin-like site-specific DNA recombinase
VQPLTQQQEQSILGLLGKYPYERIATLLSVTIEQIRHVRRLYKSGRNFYLSYASGQLHPSSKLTYAEYQDLIENLRKGVTFRKLAEQYGVSRHAIVQFARKHGLTRPSGTYRRNTKESKKLFHARNKRMMQLFNQGVDPALIAQEYGVTRLTVIRILNKERKRAGGIQSR